MVLTKIIKDSNNISSSREYDEINNNLNVKNNPLTQEGVASYLGKEIPNFEELGLEPEKIYQVYRPKEVLTKYVNTFNKLPLTIEHPDNSDLTEIPKERIIGTSGENAYIEENNGITELKNSLSVWDNTYVDKIRNNEITGLSCGYLMIVEKKKGEWNGKKYDLIITDIKGNHIALTDNPRIKGSMVADSNNKGGLIMSIFEKWFGMKNVKLSKDSSEVIDVVMELLEKGDVDKAKEVIAKLKEVAEPVETATDNDGKTTDDTNENKTTQDEEKPLTKDDVAKMISDMLNKNAEDNKTIQDEENKNKEIAQDCASKLGMGTITGVTSDSMFKTILKENSVPVTDSMSKDMIKGMALMLANQHKQSKTANHIVTDSNNIPSDLQDLIDKK